MFALGSFANLCWWGKGTFLLSGRGALWWATWLGEGSAGWDWPHWPLSQASVPWTAILSNYIRV